MLAEFDTAFAGFERDAYSLLHECHFDAGKDLDSFKVQMQAQSLATDVGYLSMVMRDLHQAAIQEVSDEMDRDNAEYQNYLQRRMDEVGPSLVLNDEFFRNQPRRERKISLPLQSSVPYSKHFSSRFVVIKTRYTRSDCALPAR